MKIKLLVLIFGLSLLVTANATTTLRSDVLGLHLRMSREAVHQRLAKAGRLEREERGRQEVWTLTSDSQFATLLVGYDRDYHVRYVTAIAHEGGRRMRYSDVAPLKDARFENAGGVYRRYTWEFKPDAKRTGYFLIAEGRDPEFLKSFSIKQRN